MLLLFRFLLVRHPRLPSARPSTAAPQALLLAIPLEIRPPALVQRFLRFSLVAARDYFPVHMAYEDREALEALDSPCIIAYEPHSVLPQGMCIFCEYGMWGRVGGWCVELCGHSLRVCGGGEGGSSAGSYRSAACTLHHCRQHCGAPHPLPPSPPHRRCTVDEDLPEGLRHTRVLTSTAGFFAPVMRNFWCVLGHGWRKVVEQLPLGACPTLGALLPMCPRPTPARRVAAGGGSGAGR
jgi:hypothetical protein